jgi:hypothetical protein
MTVNPYESPPHSVNARGARSWLKLNWRNLRQVPTNAWILGGAVAFGCLTIVICIAMAVAVMFWQILLPPSM